MAGRVHEGQGQEINAENNYKSSVFRRMFERGRRKAKYNINYN